MQSGRLRDFSYMILAQMRTGGVQNTDNLADVLYVWSLMGLVGWLAREGETEPP